LVTEIFIDSLDFMTVNSLDFMTVKNADREHVILVILLKKKFKSNMFLNTKYKIQPCFKRKRNRLNKTSNLTVTKS